jgi:hypothetical protein
MANVTVKKMQDWAISSQAPEMGTVQRLGLRPVEASASKRPALGNERRYSLVCIERCSSLAKAVWEVALLHEGNDYLGGFGIYHTSASNSRIVKWDSAG